MNFTLNIILGEKKIFSLRNIYMYGDMNEKLFKAYSVNPIRDINNLFFLIYSII